MKIYHVKHYAEITYDVIVLAEDEDQAMESSYPQVLLDPPEEFHWQDSKILDEFETDDPNAPEVELEVLENNKVARIYNPG